jgi:expansin (peptidoglycan-binding protein)
MAKETVLFFLPAILHVLSGGGGSGSDVLFDQQRQGHATYYTSADGTGACMLEALPEPQYVGALNRFDFYSPTVDGKGYQQASLCGAYARVTGSKGSVDIKIVDLCPDDICTKGHLDLSPEAFAAVGDIGDGYIPISWQLLSKSLDGSVRFRYKDGSSQWWTAIQVRNHRNPVATLEVKQGSSWRALTRTDYNYFLAENGLGTGYHTFRITDVLGNRLVETSSIFLDQYHSEPMDWIGSGQFPAP